MAIRTGRPFVTWAVLGDTAVLPAWGYADAITYDAYADSACNSSVREPSWPAPASA